MLLTDAEEVKYRKRFDHPLRLIPIGTGYQSGG